MQKVALSFLISILLFGAFAALAFTGLFDLLEARFYNPTVAASITRDNARNAEVIEKYLSEMQINFSRALREDVVRRAFLPNHSVRDIQDRERVIMHLMETNSGIQWVRFIDSGGVRIHFSTFPSDLQSQHGYNQTYNNYNELYLPYEMIAVRNGENPKYTLDEWSSRILFSFPLYDSFDAYWGTAMFSLSVDALASRLIAEGRLRFGQDVTVISNPAGMLFGITSDGESALPHQISRIWSEDGIKTARLFSQLSRQYLVLITAKTSQGVFISRLVNERLFSLPKAMEIILLASFFITVFLIVFLLFNLRQDPVAVVQNRLKQLQISVVEQFYDLKGEADWIRWMRDLDTRRDEIMLQLKKGVKITSSGKAEDIDLLINQSWDELIAVLGGRKDEGIDEEKLQSVLKRVLADLSKTELAKLSGTSNIQSTVSTGTAATGARPSLLMKATAIVKELEETEEVEELEELTDAEDDVSEAAQKAAPEPAMEEEKTMLTGANIAHLASEIEFSPDPEPDSSEDESLKEFLEIVSPFEGMQFNFSDSDNYDDINAGENPPGADDSGEIIEEMEGVPYISEEALSPDSKTKAPIDRGFKDLVDSVIGPKN